MSLLSMREPAAKRPFEELEAIRESLMECRSTDAVIRIDADGFIVSPQADDLTSRLTSTQRPRLLAGLVRSFKELTGVSQRIADAHAARDEAEVSKVARIVAIVPTFEREDEIDKAVESLLLQTRPIDRIAVVINGPGESAEAFNRLKWLAVAFPEQLRVVCPPSINGRDAGGASKGSKVGALNWAYRYFLAKGDFDFMLGVDADVVADEEMVHHLEDDLLRRARAGGVRARYSFKIPSREVMKGKSTQLVYGQRHEFTKKELDDALQGNTAHILGGQATLFDVPALREVARISDGYVPWSDKTLVEDAELTRKFEQLGYRPAVSARARAWTGLMYTPHAWQKQRRKWQDGHLMDMTRDFRPVQDFRRWKEQIGLGWNLLLRVLFALVVTMSFALDTLTLSPLWLIPLGIVTAQSLIIALKTPSRSLREVVRALLYIPGEIYYLRTLSVWLDSVIVVTLNVRRDGWGNQAAAESGQKKTAISGWILILTAVTVPIAGLLVLERFIAPDIMAAIVAYGWYVVTAMTAFSVVAMLWFIIRVLRSWRTLNP